MALNLLTSKLADYILSLEITWFCAGDTSSCSCNPTIYIQWPSSVWLAIKSIWRTLGISSAVRLHWVGNHYHFSSLFAWQTKHSYLGLGVQYWAIDWHPSDSASVRHNMEHHRHNLQFVGDLRDCSGNNLCSCCSFGCCCRCDHL